MLDVQEDAIASEESDLDTNAVEDSFENRTHRLVDGSETCLLYAECTLPLAENSRYCRYHTETVVVLQLKSNANRLGPSASKPRPDVAKWRDRTRDDVSWLVSNINSDNGRTRWLIDTEFCNPAGNISPIAMEIAIRDLDTGQLLLSSTVDYDGITKEDMMEELGLNQATQMRRVVFTSCFNKIYPK